MKKRLLMVFASMLTIGSIPGAVYAQDDQAIPALEEMQVVYSRNGTDLGIMNEDFSLKDNVRMSVNNTSEDRVTILSDGEVMIETDGIAITADTMERWLILSQDVDQQSDWYYLYDDPEKIVDEMKNSGYHYICFFDDFSIYAYVTSYQEIWGSYISDLDAGYSSEDEENISQLAATKFEGWNGEYYVSGKENYYKFTQGGMCAVYETYRNGQTIDIFVSTLDDSDLTEEQLNAADDLCAHFQIESRDYTEAEADSSVMENEAGSSVSGNTIFENADYIMIYNPKIYDEGDNTVPQDFAYLYTGEIGKQIQIDMDRAELPLETEAAEYVSLSRNDLNFGSELPEIEMQQVRAGGLDPEYVKGEQHNFYIPADPMGGNELLDAEFTCLYDGDHCYIWGLSETDITEDTALEMGTYFDMNIYDLDVEAFGTPRFTENGGKIHILYYAMPEMLGGFFSPRDIFSSEEIPDDMAEAYQLNRDHAILHLNSVQIYNDMEFALSTMAHELQHLICASDTFYYADMPFMSVWLDETMSAYAEENLFEGIKVQKGYNVEYYVSDSIKKGQSIYNFDSSQDIGVYGEAYFFEKYLSELMGDEVFYQIHDYWRRVCDANASEASALQSVLSTEYVEEINSRYPYTAEISGLFASQDEVFISKMMLDFYLRMLNTDNGEIPVEYKNIVEQMMLYDEVNPTEIEGGGRIVFRLKDGGFSVPQDADNGLIYVGLDQDFQVIDIVM